MEMFYIAVLFTVAALTEAQTCGQPQVYSGRVIGGRNAARGAWPWQILLLDNNRPICGGSIIAPNWILTASHCIVNPNTGRTLSPYALTVRVGEHDMRKHEIGQKDYRVTKVIRHPLFSFNTFNSDVALLKLSSPVQYNKFVQPVCLPTTSAPAGTNCMITGWGRTNRWVRNMHHTLQQAPMPVVDIQTCAYAMWNVARFQIGRHNICSGYGRTRISGCQGDSGGPFVCKSGNNWYLHGAVSWGSKDCSSKHNEYTVYANVANLRTWIDDNMKFN